MPEDFYRHYQLLEERYEVGIGLHRYRRQASFTSSHSHWAEPDRLAEWGLLLPSPLDTCQPSPEAKMRRGDKMDEDSR